MVKKTVWSAEEPAKEKEWIKKLQEQRIWEAMEEDFKAKQLVITLIGINLFLSVYALSKRTLLDKQKKAELRSVLDPTTKKHIGQYLPLSRTQRF